MSRHPIRNERTGWRDTALCSSNPDLWFSKSSLDRKLARKLCGECEANPDCLAAALGAPLRDGIVAGRSPNQIARLKKEQRRVA
jgi:hypothetical protein